MNIIIIGGHGKIALRLAKLLTSASHTVTSVIRTPSHSADITALAAAPKVLSLEDDPAQDFTNLFSSTRADLVYFAAGAGGKGGASRTKAVDYLGALKIFDAIEGLPGDVSTRPRLVLVSAIDTRDPDKLGAYPPHYNDEDKETSKKAHDAIGEYYKWKWEADKNLVKRKGFKWTILKPGGLSDSPGEGKVDIGLTHITKSIPRDDVAATLFHLASRPDAHGLALDLVGGTKSIEEALDAAIKKGESDYFE